MFNISTYYIIQDVASDWGGFHVMKINNIKVWKFTFEYPKILATYTNLKDAEKHYSDLTVKDIKKHV